MRILTVVLLLAMAFSLFSIGFLAGMSDAPGKIITIGCWVSAAVCIVAAIYFGITLL